MHFIEEVFGEGCDLYEVISCPRDADGAKLRKCYYRAALKYHPDRNQTDEAHRQFQAISMIYRILHDADSRADYDSSGAIPAEAPDDDDREMAGKSGADEWKRYFDRIFGKVTVGGIEAFAAKYKCSDEERRDVLKEFKARKGNLVKMLEFVVLSEPRDAVRWVEDYINPAFEAGDLDPAKYRAAMEKSLKACQKKAEKENQEEQHEGDDEDDDDEEETETEEDGEDDDGTDEEAEGAAPKKRQQAAAAAASKNNKKQGKPKKETPRKAKPTKAKAAKKKRGGTNDMSDLVAQIQNRNRGGGGGGNLLASLGARYGVSMDGDGGDGDPLDDAEFERIQSRMKNNNKNKKQTAASGGRSSNKRQRK